jgi:hypothetical protein
MRRVANAPGFKCFGNRVDAVDEHRYDIIVGSEQSIKAILRLRYLFIVSQHGSRTRLWQRSLPFSQSRSSRILSCDVRPTSALQAHASSRPTVSYDIPVATRGTPPVTRARACRSRGSEFPNGITTVVCEASRRSRPQEQLHVRRHGHARAATEQNDVPGVWRQPDRRQGRL